MNIDVLLPLLLKGNKNSDMIKTLAAIRNGDKAAAIEAMLPQDKRSDELLGALKFATKKPPAAGLGPIEGFASNEILGMFVRYYSAPLSL